MAGWDEHTIYVQRVRNYTAKPIEVEVRRTFPGHVVFRSELKAKNHDYQTVEYTATVRAGQKADLLYEIVPAPGPQRQAEQRDHPRGKNRVRVTSDYSRLGTQDLKITRIGNRIVNEKRRHAFHCEFGY